MYGLHGLGQFIFLNAELPFQYKISFVLLMFPYNNPQSVELCKPSIKASFKGVYSWTTPTHRGPQALGAEFSFILL